MFFVTVKRIIKNGVISFWRNRWVSLATILVMVLALFMVGALLFLNVLLSSALLRLENKVDISVYFKTDAAENEIKNLSLSLSSLPQVKEVEYISREQALDNFKKRHQNNSLITRSLDELEGNPLGASLNIKAKELGQYEAIARFLEAGVYSSLIDKVDYSQNQLVISRLSGILGASRRVGLGASLVLAVIAVLVAFNTIRLAIYTNREEISVMRLVGAKNSYIRGPYIMEGILHGVLAASAAMIIFYILTLWLGPRAEHFFGGPDLFAYYLANFFEIFAVLLFAGVFLGMISSWIAVKRYLKI
ncbi:MAG: ABC transporter permease [Candidatus Niyogibacteria bacterium]|nr:ABC transporter permease [Candidatus Niyogibacteria bacterium]